MKHAKRLLAIALTLLLAFAVAMPAVANAPAGTPAITQQPQDRTLRAGQASDLRVTATILGGGTMGFVWQEVLPNNTFTTFATTSSFFPFTVDTAWTTRTFRVIVYNAADRELPLEQRRQVISNHATVTRADGIPVITQQPESQTAPAGSNVTFRATATMPGYSFADFTWQELQGGNWVQASTTVSGNFTVRVEDNWTVRTFRAVVWNWHDNHLPLAQRRQVITDTVTVTRDTSFPTITQQPTIQGSMGYVGDPITVSAAAAVENGDPVGFQWFLRQGTGGAGQLVEGATNATFSFNPTHQGVNVMVSVTAYNANDSHLPLYERRLVGSDTLNFTARQTPRPLSTGQRIWAGILAFLAIVGTALLAVLAVVIPIVLGAAPIVFVVWIVSLAV
ncbi:MAG: hypothetical protein FWD06_05150 [Oscillospiraceae bacterium]|nr:hypothetical protein [Oscillospiraceae bacterium]